MKNMLVEIEGTKDSIPNSIYSEKGPVLEVAGRQFLKDAKAEKETWITWFLPRESKEFYDTCFELTTQGIQFKISVISGTKSEEIEDGLNKKLPKEYSDKMNITNSDIAEMF